MPVKPEMVHTNDNDIVIIGSEWNAGETQGKIEQSATDR